MLSVDTFEEVQAVQLYSSDGKKYGSESILICVTVGNILKELLHRPINEDKNYICNWNL